jgi:hypothetical protein
LINKNLKTKFIYALFLALILYNRSNCQDLTSFGINGLSGYDFKNQRHNSTIAFNGYLKYFNFSFDYRINSKIETSKNNDILIFAGVGYYHYYQFQLGRSSSGITYLRQRTDWTLTELGFSKKGQSVWKYNPLDAITLSAFIDRAINDNRQDWIVGIGIGYSLRITGILH